MSDTAGRRTLDQEIYQLEREDERLVEEDERLAATEEELTAAVAASAERIASLNDTIAATDAGSPDGDPSLVALQAELAEETVQQEVRAAQTEAIDARQAEIGARRAAIVIALSDLNAAVASLAAAPQIDGVIPATLYVGDAATTVQVVGAGFTADTTAQFDGTSVVATFVSDGLLTVVVPPELFTAAAEAELTLATPEPGGGSCAYTMQIVQPAPSIWRVTPSYVAVGAAVTLTVHGAWFTAASVVEIDGVVRAATLVDGRLVVPLTAAELPSTQGAMAVTVRTAGPGGGSSEVILVPVAPAPRALVETRDGFWFLSRFTDEFAVRFAYEDLFRAQIFDTQSQTMLDADADAFDVVSTRAADGSRFSFELTYREAPSLRITLRAERSDRGFVFLGPQVEDDPTENDRYCCAGVTWPRLALPPLGDPERFYGVSTYTTGFVDRRPQRVGYGNIQGVDQMGFVAFYDADTRRVVLLWHDDETYQPLFLATNGTGAAVKIEAAHNADRHFEPGRSWSRDYRVHLEAFVGAAEDGRLCCYDAALRYREWAANAARPWRARGPWATAAGFSDRARDCELHVTFSGQLQLETATFTNVMPRWLAQVAPFAEPLITIYGWKNAQELTWGAPDYAQAGAINTNTVAALTGLKAAGFHPVLYVFPQSWDALNARAGWRPDDYAQATDPSIPSDLTSYFLRDGNDDLVVVPLTVPDPPGLLGETGYITGTGPYDNPLNFPDFAHDVWPKVLADVAHRYWTALGAPARPAGSYWDAMGSTWLPAFAVTPAVDPEMELGVDADWTASEYYTGKLAALAAFRAASRTYDAEAVSLTEWPAQPFVPLLDFVFHNSGFPNLGVWSALFHVVHGDAVRFTTFGNQISGEVNASGLAAAGEIAARTSLLWLRSGVVSFNDATEYAAPGNPTDPELVHATLTDSPLYYWLLTTRRLQAMSAACRPYFAGHLMRPAARPDWRGDCFESQPYATATAEWTIDGTDLPTIRGIIDAGHPVAPGALATGDLVVTADGAPIGAAPGDVLRVTNGATPTFVVLTTTRPSGRVYADNTADVGDAARYPAGRWYWYPEFSTWGRAVRGFAPAATDLSGQLVGDVVLDAHGELLGGPRNALVRISAPGAVGAARFSASVIPAHDREVENAGVMSAGRWGDVGSPTLRYDAEHDRWSPCGPQGFEHWFSSRLDLLTLLSETWRRTNGELGVMLVNWWPAVADRKPADTAFLSAIEATSDRFGDRVATVAVDTERDGLPAGEKIVYRTVNAGARTEIARFVGSWYGEVAVGRGTVVLIEVVAA